MQMPGGRGRGRGGGGRGKDGVGHGGRGGGQGQGQGQGGQGPGGKKGTQRTRGESERSEGDEERCLVCLNKMEVGGLASFSRSPPKQRAIFAQNFLLGFLCWRVQSSNMPYLHNQNEGNLFFFSQNILRYQCHMILLYYYADFRCSVRGMNAQFVDETFPRCLSIFLHSPS